MWRLFIMLLLVLLSACAIPARSEQMVDGYDADSRTTIDPINLWSSYAPRGHLVGRVRSGAQVTLISRDGDGCEIETANGVRGWLNCAFLR